MNIPKTRNSGMCTRNFNSLKSEEMGSKANLFYHFLVICDVFLESLSVQ